MFPNKKTIRESDETKIVLVCTSQKFMLIDRYVRSEEVDDEVGMVQMKIEY